MNEKNAKSLKIVQVIRNDIDEHGVCKFLLDVHCRPMWPTFTSYDIFSIEYWRDLEMWLRRSFKII